MLVFGDQATTKNMNTLYDRIGFGYANLRHPDPRIADAIHDALGSASTVLNIGAGTGSYEPTDREVVALEPSMEMIQQRAENAATAVQGVAEKIPFDDGSFDATMAVMTVHHWTDFEAGIREMQRVAKERLVVMTFDPSGPYFWLADYIPEIIELDQSIMPRLSDFKRLLGEVKIEPVPVPHDCIDGFLGAYWRRPSQYLDPKARAAISTFAKYGDFPEALDKLRYDIESGIWAKRYADLLQLDSLDIGYRLVVAEKI